MSHTMILIPTYTSLPFHQLKASPTIITCWRQMKPKNGFHLVILKCAAACISNLFGLYREHGHEDYFDNTKDQEHNDINKEFPTYQDALVFVHTNYQCVTSFGTITVWA